MFNRKVYMKGFSLASEYRPVSTHSPYGIRALIVFGLAVVLAALVWVAPATSAGAQTAEESNLISLINGYRSANGLSPLVTSPTLNYAAAWKTQDMASNNYFAHTDSLGRSAAQRITDLGYAYNVWKGEDLAAGVASAAEVLQLWQNSPAHNAILLSQNYVAIGIGSAYSEQSDYFWYWAGAFGGYDDTAVFTPPPAEPPSVPEPPPAAPAPLVSEPAQVTTTPGPQAVEAVVVSIAAPAPNQVQMQVTGTVNESRLQVLALIQAIKERSALSGLDSFARDANRYVQSWLNLANLIT